MRMMSRTVFHHTCRAHQMNFGDMSLSRLQTTQLVSKFISMAPCKTAVTPVHQQWSYCSFALSRRHDSSALKIRGRHLMCNTVVRLHWFNAELVYFRLTRCQVTNFDQISHLHGYWYLSLNSLQSYTYIFIALFIQECLSITPKERPALA